MKQVLYSGIHLHQSRLLLNNRVVSHLILIIFPVLILICAAVFSTLSSLSLHSAPFSGPPFTSFPLSSFSPGVVPEQEDEGQTAETLLAVVSPSH